MSEQVPAWISQPVRDNRIDALRTDLFAQVDAADVYRAIETPHVTIHPGFTTTPDGIAALRDYLAARETLPEATVTDLYAHPDRDDPMVVALGIDIPLETLRDDVQTILDAHDSTTIYDPVPAHLTLFKSRGENGTIEDTWDGLPAAAHDRLRDALDAATLPETPLALDPPHVDTQNPPTVPDDE